MTTRAKVRPGSEKGAILVVVLLALSAVGATLASLLSLATTERLLGSVEREAVEYRYAAEAIAGFAVGDLSRRDDWSTALSAGVPSSFADSTRAPVLSGGRRLDLIARAAAFGPVEPGAWGADEPQWVLYAWGWAGSLSPALRGSRIYVTAWLADDERDGDRNASRDSNGRIWVRGEAFGPVRGQRTVIIHALRLAPAPAALQILDWRFP